MAGQECCHSRLRLAPFGASLILSLVTAACYPFSEFDEPRDPEVIGVIAEVEFGEGELVTYTLANGDEVRVDLAEQTERDGVLDPGSLLLFAEGDPDVYFGAGPAPEDYFNFDGCFWIHQPARMEDGFVVFAHGLRLPQAEGFRWASEPDPKGA